MCQNGFFFTFRAAWRNCVPQSVCVLLLLPQNSSAALWLYAWLQRVASYVLAVANIKSIMSVWQGKYAEIRCWQLLLLLLTFLRYYIPNVWVRVCGCVFA